MDTGNYANETLLKSDHGPEPPFDEDVFELFEIILRMVIIGVISFFGIISNSINLIVFYRQGILSHSCNVSLAALAVSDFLFCLLVFWGSICLYHEYYVDQTRFRWNALDFHTFTSYRPAIMFSDNACWVTAFVAFERLISVMFPFKVKDIFTPKRSCVIIVCIFVTIFGIHFPYEIAYTPRWTKIPPNNVTIIKYRVFELLPKTSLDVSYYGRFVLRVASMTCVLVCNVIISLKVMLSKKFQTSTTSSSLKDPQAPSPNTQNSSKQANTDNSSNSTKEMKMLRMITTVCVIFSICYTTEFLHICIYNISGMKFMIDYHWISEYTFGMMVTFFLTINSSCNIFVYYNMSTRYREELKLCILSRKM